jgi:hypothetical protein
MLNNVSVNIKNPRLLKAIEDFVREAKKDTTKSVSRAFEGWMLDALAYNRPGAEPTSARSASDERCQEGDDGPRSGPERAELRGDPQAP